MNRSAWSLESVRAARGYIRYARTLERHGMPERGIWWRGLADQELEQARRRVRK